MQYSKNAVNLIKKWEGLFLKSYLCPAKVWTIGYGSIRWQDGSPIKRGQTITEKQATDLLLLEIKEKSDALDALNLNINQNQFDSLVSFIYNLGIGAFIRSTLLRLIRQNPKDNLLISAEFLKWNKIRQNGKLIPLQGLTNRRRDEIALYCL